MSDPDTPAGPSDPRSDGPPGWPAPPESGAPAPPEPRPPPASPPPDPFIVAPPPGPPPAPPPSGPPPGAPRPPAWARPPRPGQASSFQTLGGDPGAWASAGILGGVLLSIVGDVLLAADRISISTFRAYARGTLRARFLVLSSFASIDVAVALLVAVGLALAIRPSAPASFRRTVVAGIAALAALIVVLAVLRALVVITYGHAFGVGGFVQNLAAIPVAVAALGIAMIATRSSRS